LRFQWIVNLIDGGIWDAHKLLESDQMTMLPDCDQGHRVSDGDTARGESKGGSARRWPH
jgi:hypothetical protein